jgi:acyl carrier protein
MLFSRRRAQPLHVEPGKEIPTFLSEISQIVQREVAEEDIDLNLREDLGCDDLDQIECIMAGEEVWKVELFPNPASGDDYQEAAARFTTLGAIITAARKIAGK